jgi:hypothetical protein
MMKLKAGLKMILNPELNGKMSLKTGYAQTVVLEKKILIWLRYRNA